MMDTGSPAGRLEQVAKLAATGLKFGGVSGAVSGAVLGMATGAGAIGGALLGAVGGVCGGAVGLALSGAMGGSDRGTSAGKSIAASSGALGFAVGGLIGLWAMKWVSTVLDREVGLQEGLAGEALAIEMSAGFVGGVLAWLLVGAAKRPRLAGWLMPASLGALILLFFTYPITLLLAVAGAFGGIAAWALPRSIRNWM